MGKVLLIPTAAVSYLLYAHKLTLTTMIFLHLCVGLYCSGWVKRGPRGAILNTMDCAFETADEIANDLKTGRSVSQTELQQIIQQTIFYQVVAVRSYEHTDTASVI